MRRVLVAAGILVVLLVILDRVAVVVAERAVAKQIRAELALKQTPSVSIHGFPFLQQAVTVRYDDLAQASGIPGLRIARSGDDLRVSGQVQLPGGQVEASALGHISVEDNDLVVTADQAQVGGVELPPALLATAARLLSFRVSPKSLPLALRITGVQIGVDSLTVAAQAHDVVLRRGEI